MAQTMTMSIGFGLILIGFFAEWLLKKRLKNSQLQKPLMWVAWSFALLGGVASENWAHGLHISHFAAGVVSLLALLWIVVDLWDKRPDWAAVILIAIVPAFMVLTGGPVGAFFEFLLGFPTSLVGGAGGMFGA